MQRLTGQAMADNYFVSSLNELLLVHANFSRVFFPVLLRKRFCGGNDTLDFVVTNDPSA